MAESRTYVRITKANLGALPVPQSFLDKRGPIYKPGDPDPVEVTSANSTIREALELKYPNAIVWLEHTDNQAPERTDEENATHALFGLPNLSQKEITDILGAAEALGFNTLPVIFAHDEALTYLREGTLPPV